MVSLIALIVGGLGVGATMQSHLRQKMTNIAFMKCIGGRSEHILYIYLAQALWLGILGSVLGAILGAFAQSVFARIDRRLLRCPGDADLAVGGHASGNRRRTGDDGTVFSPAVAGDSRHPASRPCCKRLLRESPPRHGIAQACIAAAAAIVGLWGIAVWVSASLLYATRVRREPRSPRSCILGS